MHKIGFNGKKLLEAICFEGLKEVTESKPVSLGEYSINKLVTSQVIINSAIQAVREKGDALGMIDGYNLGKLLVGRKNAVYITAIVEEDAKNKIINISAKGNRYSIKKFENFMKER